MPRCLRSEFLRLITGRGDAGRRARLTRWTDNFLESSRRRSSNRELRKRGGPRARSSRGGKGIGWLKMADCPRSNEKTTFHRDPSEFPTNFFALRRSVSSRIGASIAARNYPKPPRANNGRSSVFPTTRLRRVASFDAFPWLLAYLALVFYSLLLPWRILLCNTNNSIIVCFKNRVE